MKLKLLYALFSGRHVMANDNILHGTGLENACYKAESPEQFVQGINQLMNVEFSEEQKKERIALLNTHYNNMQNAQRIMTCLQQ